MTRVRRVSAGRTRPYAAVVATLGVAVAAVVTAAPSAQAGNQHAIQTAPSPSTGQPVTGGGSWVVNKPSGYYIGRALPGTTFDDELTTSANWHYGRAVGALDMCGYVMPGSMGASRGTTADSCSATTRSTLAHRLDVGHDFNADPSATSHVTDGTRAPAVDRTCTLYQNYFHGSDLRTGGGYWANPVGNLSGDDFYRFTTPDGRAVVVRDQQLGWGFASTSCITRPTPFSNVND